MSSCSSAATRAARRTPDTAIANPTAVGLGSVAAQESVAISGTVHCRPLSTAPVGIRRTSCGSFLGRGTTSHVFDILRLVVVCAAAVAVVVFVMV